jgi:hypothetical protein
MIRFRMRRLRPPGKQCDATDWARFRLRSRRADHFALRFPIPRAAYGIPARLRGFGVTVIDLSQKPTAEPVKLWCGTFREDGTLLWPG